MVLISGCFSNRNPAIGTVNILESRHDVDVATFLDEEHKGKNPIWEPIIGMKLIYDVYESELLQVVYHWDEEYGKFAVTTEIQRGDLRLIEKYTAVYVEPGEIFTIKIWFDDKSWYCMVNDNMWFLGHIQETIINWNLVSWCKSNGKFIKKDKFRFTWN